MASFTEKRRARLRRAIDRIERLEPRNTITEPISITALSVSALSGLARLGVVQVHGGGEALKTLQAASEAARQRGNKATAGAAILPLPRPGDVLPIAVGSGANQAAAGWTKGSAQAASGAWPGGNSANAGGDWLNLSPASNQSTETGISTPWQPAKPPSGGPSQAPRGSLNVPRANSGHGAINPLRVPPPASASASAAGGSAALLAAAASATKTAPAGAAGVAPRANPAGSPGASSPPGSSINPFDGGPTSSGGSPPGSTPDPVTGNSSGASLQTFAYFPVYVLDWNDGSVMMPGAYQFATLGSHVDLRAQVVGTTVSSIGWDTSQIVGVSNTISGANTYHLTFNWSGSPPALTVKAITLSVTDTHSHTETFAYDFLVPSGGGTISGGGSATWPSSLPPDLVLDQAPAMDSQNVSVDSTSGALNTTLDLPSYNPNVPALSLTYNSMTADPRPIVVIPHTLDSTQTTPSQVSGQITVKDTSGNTKYTGSTWYYDTSQFMPGDVQQIALQADMTGQSTGRYNYTATVVDYRTTNTTTTITGTETVLNQSSSTFGDGWTLDGLEQITSASGGVILSLGEGGKTLWFSGSPGSSGGNYTDPAGEFSTLSKNSGSGGGYTRTLTDGTEITFDSNGRETATIDTDGLHITYSYDSGGNLTKITDPYSNVTTLTYSGGYLQTITDPANRVTTVTHSGGNLTGATLPDGSNWGYAYDRGGRLTQVTDPNSKTTSIAYDGADRASTITRPDNSKELFLADQEQGWTNSGTSGSPATATLLATAASNYTDPDSNLTSQHPD